MTIIIMIIRMVIISKQISARANVTYAECASLITGYCTHTAAWEMRVSLTSRGRLSDALSTDRPTNVRPSRTHILPERKNHLDNPYWSMSRRGDNRPNPTSYADPWSSVLKRNSVPKRTCLPRIRSSRVHSRGIPQGVMTRTQPTRQRAMRA